MLDPEMGKGFAMTLKLHALHVADLTSPAAWDRRLNTSNEPARLMSEIDPTESGLHARRYLQAAVATCNLEIVAAALRVFDTQAPAGAEGVRLSALATLRRYEEVRATPLLLPTSTDPAILENVADADLARCIAYSEMGNHAQALAHLQSGRVLASALGMAYRAQWMQIETGRTLTIMGAPAPAQIEEAMNTLPMSARRHRWGRRTLAEAYMAQGEYGRAAEVLLPERCDFWHFASAMIGDTSSRATLAAAKGGYADLARAVWTLYDRTPMTKLPSFEHYPERGYAQILRARHLVANPALRAQSVGTLASMRLEDLMPDQRAMMAIIKLGACAENADVAVSHVAIAELNEALNSLKTLEYVIPLGQVGSPERFALAALVPGAHPELVLRLSDLPILVGEHVQYRSLSIKLPGKAAGGVTMVRAAYHGEMVHLHTETVRRTRNALAAHDIAHGLVNIGYLLRCLKRFHDAALPEQRGAWVASIDSVLSMIDSRALRTDLAKEICGPLERRRK